MLPHRYFSVVMRFWTCLLMSTTMCICMSLINTGSFSLLTSLPKVGIAFIVSCTASSVIPVQKWSYELCKMLNVESSPIASTLLNNAVPTVVFGSLMNFVFTALTIGFTSFFLITYLADLPKGLFVAYTLGFFIQPIASMLTKGMCPEGQ